MTTVFRPGLIAPPAPADAEIVYVSSANVAEIVWLARTSLKPYDVTAPAETPSTRTSTTEWQRSGMMLNVCWPPHVRATVPPGRIIPPLPEDVAMA